MKQKIILIENENQAREYLKNKEEYKNYFPITFGALTENLFLEKDIKFKTEDDYEDVRLYKGISLSSIEEVEKLYKKFEVKYKEINLLKLFQWELFKFLTETKTKLVLLKQIIKKEKPQEIFIFKENLKKEQFSRLILEIYKGGKRFKELNIKKKKEKREKILFKLISLIQKQIIKINLNLIPESKNKIFYNGGGIFETLVPELLKNKKNKVFKFNDNLRSSFIGKKYIPFYEIFGKKINKREKLNKKIEKFIKKLKKTNLNKEIKLNKELEKIIKEELINLAKINFYKICKNIEEMNSLIKKGGIDLLMLSDDSIPLTKSFVELGKKFKIPSIVFLHGLPATYKYYPMCPVEADYIVLDREEIKKDFIKYGTKEEKIKLLGCPRYDLLKEKKIAKDRKIIAYLMEVTMENKPDNELTKREQKEILKKIIKVMKKFQDYKLIVKTKAFWEMNDLLEKIIKKEDYKNIKIIGKTNNIKLLNKIDIAIIGKTTMGVEALILDKPVICFSLKRFDNINPYKKIKGVNLVYDEKQLERVIKKSEKQTKKDSDKRKKYLGKYLLDKKATERSIKFINEVLSQE